MLKLTKGILVALEGIDGSGKTTLAHNLFTVLKAKNFDVIATREPGATDLGKKVREIVQTQNVALSPLAEYLLFAADRAQHFAELIIPQLAENKLIISDRMSDSSLAYQGYGNKLDLAMIKTINNWSMKNIKPDLTIFVQVPVSIALERAKKRGSLSAYEKREKFLSDVATGFEEIYKNRTDIIKLDGTQNQDTLTHQCYAAVTEWLKKK